MPQPKIKVFWDLVSCPPSMSYASPAEVLNDVRLFTSNFGVVTSIKAYWDRHKARQLNDPLRAAMPSMGVNLLDCSSMQGYTDDALTKMLTVDALISAMDDPVNLETAEKDIIMIISGDESVLYPISLLMFRNYTVFLVVPDESNGIQPFQATRVFNWYRDVLGFKSSLGSEPTSLPTITSSRPQGWIINEIHAPRFSPTSALMSPSSLSVASAPSALTPSRPVISSATPRSKSESLPSSEPPVSRAPSVLSSNPEAPIIRSLGVAHDEGAASAISKPNNSSPYTEVRSIRAPPPVPEETTQENSEDDWGTSGGWNASGGWEMTSVSWDSGLASSVSERKEAGPKPEVKHEPRSKQESRLTSSATSKLQTARNSAPVQGFKTPGMKPEPTALADPPMSVFDPLLQVLREAEKQTMRRSQLGEQLAKRKGLYQSAGVGGFGEFITLAVKKNLIIVCGNDNHQQVKLKKRR